MTTVYGPWAAEAARGETAPEVLRGACRQALETDGLSSAAGARQIGVSSTTLSTWLRDVYRGDSEAVAAKVRRWLDTRADAARRGVGGAGLDRHAETGAYCEVSAALAYGQANGDVVLIHGPSGRGKTWAARRHVQEWTGGHYLAVTGATVTLAGLLSRVADAVGAGGRHGSALEAEGAVVARLVGRQSLLVVDEAHHLRGQLLDELRCLRDLAGCGLALLGDDTIRVTLARCPQVVGRIGLRVDLRTQSTADVHEIAAGVLGRRPAAAEVRLLDAAATGPGGLHAVRRLMARAWLLARADERDAVTAQDLAAAAEQGGES